MKILLKLKKEENKAVGKLREELQRQFPKGTRVSFMIKHGQINPSIGEVIGYRDHGYLAVRHDQAKKNSRYGIRDVSFDLILETKKEGV
jgi:hypothetical protein